MPVHSPIPCRVPLDTAPDAFEEAVERDPSRPGYCWAHKLSYVNTARRRYQDSEFYYASKADAEADAAFQRCQQTDGTEVIVSRVYTAEDGLFFGRRFGGRRVA